MTYGGQLCFLTSDEKCDFYVYNMPGKGIKRTNISNTSDNSSSEDKKQAKKEE